MHGPVDRAAPGFPPIEPLPDVSPAPSERAVKRERALAVLRSRPDAHSLVLTSAAALSWYLDGSRVHVSTASDPVLLVVVTESTDTVLVPANEAQRLVEEELPPDVVVSTRAWHEDLLGPGLAPGSPGVLHESDVAGELRAARAALLPGELARFAALGSDAAVAVTDALARTTATSTEREICAMVGANLIAVGADPVVLLAAGHDRLRYRHPLPTDGVLGSRAMFVVCARRHGLVANLTRWVRFTEPSAQERDREQRLLAVESDFLAATRPGRTMADVFRDAIGSYPRNGFGRDEWRNHHQGGPTGYNARDPRATARVPDRVQVTQAFAWNPTVPVGKIEDTVVITEAGARVLTVDPSWPTVPVGTLARPTELVR